MALKKIERNIKNIDVKGINLGRAATQIAVWLQGKHKVSFQRHLDMGDIVEVLNVEKMNFTGRKLDNKYYYKSTGYIGHLKKEKLKDLLKRKPDEVLRLAVYGMLPKNKLRPRMIKRLTFK